MNEQPIRRFAVRREVISRPVGDEVILLDLASGTYFSLGAVGAFVWEQLRVGLAFSAIVDRVVADYDVDSDVASADILSLVNELAEKGLVEAA
jgi:Coenzyme PQQ synthesis protein D (PqqD)